MLYHWEIKRGLDTTRKTVAKALSEGQSFEQFRKALHPSLEAAGWWGMQERTDPQTGELRLVQLGSERRLRIIYDTNLRTAQAAGHWQRIEALKAVRPFLRYVAVLDARTRPDHRAWHGIILPVDHPFWNTHYPPCGWRCRCTVQQLSARDLKREGWEVSPDPVISTRPWTNPRTDVVVNVPVGIDPGWGFNVGKAGQQRAALLGQLNDRLVVAEPAAADGAVRQMVADTAFEHWLAAPAGNYPVMVMPHPAAQAIGAAEPLVVFSAESAVKNLSHHPDLTIADYRLLPEIGAAPDLIVQDGPTTVVIVRRAGRLYWAVVKATASGATNFLTSFRQTNASDVAKLIDRGQILSGQWQG